MATPQLNQQQTDGSWMERKVTGTSDRRNSKVYRNFAPSKGSIAWAGHVTDCEHLPGQVQGTEKRKKKKDKVFLFVCLFAFLKDIFLFMGISVCLCMCMCACRSLFRDRVS